MSDDNYTVGGYQPGGPSSAPLCSKEEDLPRQSQQSVRTTHRGAGYPESQSKEPEAVSKPTAPHGGAKKPAHLGATKPAHRGATKPSSDQGQQPAALVSQPWSGSANSSTASEKEESQSYTTARPALPAEMTKEETGPQNVATSST